jgi:hypothetical protein
VRAVQRPLLGLGSHRSLIFKRGSGGLSLADRDAFGYDVVNAHRALIMWFAYFSNRSQCNFQAGLGNWQHCSSRGASAPPLLAANKLALISTGAAPMAREAVLHPDLCAVDELLRTQASA